MNIKERICKKADWHNKYQKLKVRQDKPAKNTKEKT